MKTLLLFVVAAAFCFAQESPVGVIVFQETAARTAPGSGFGLCQFDLAKHELTCKSSAGTLLRMVPAVASLPATCAVGDLFSLTSASGGLYYCPTVNTPTAVGTGLAATVNGVACTIGSTCTITAAPTASSYASVTDGSPIAWNLGSAAVKNGVVILAHGTATRALNITGPASGGTYRLVVKQDSTGGAALTLGTGCTWKVAGGGTGAVTLTSTASAIDLLTFHYDGTNCYASLQTNFN